MREKEEGRPSNARRGLEEDLAGDDDVPAGLTEQALESLKPGFSWIRLMESRYPGWSLSAVEGFPFTLPRVPLSESRVCLIGLAGAYVRGQKPFNISPTVVSPRLRAMRFRDRGDWSVREIPSETESTELEIAHAHYDHSEADEDLNCVFPITRLRELEEEDLIGECAPVHYSLMGYIPEVDRLHETIVGVIIPGLIEQEVDAVVVAGGCELSHQSAGLLQREVEKAGMPTVGVSVCPDITYRLQVPRAVALRFPLGNPFGASQDASMQIRVLRDALSLLHRQETPGHLSELDYEWVKF